MLFDSAPTTMVENCVCVCVCVCVCLHVYEFAGVSESLSHLPKLTWECVQCDLS